MKRMIEFFICKIAIPTVSFKLYFFKIIPYKVLIQIDVEIL